MSEKATTAQARNEPKGGAIIADRYQVDRLIARGGMAAVYLAHHIKLNRPVALKVLSPPPDAEDGGAFEERFRLEAETLASLDHHNIVILHDFGDLDDGRFFLAMEYIDGPRLSDVLRDGPLPPDRALHLIMQVCSGLRYAHKRGVVHRDLKPSNLLIKTHDDGSEQIKVVDFGLVKLIERDQSITRAGLILGSPHCMAPEQVKGLDVDHRADIYAIGVLLFRTLTGQYPFHGPNSAATMIAHLNQPVPTFFSVAPELVVPEGLEEIVRKCLGKTPAERFHDMKDLMDALATCMDIPPEQFRSVSQSHSTIQRQEVVAPSSKGKWVVLGALLVLMLVGGGIGVGIVASGLFAHTLSMDPATTLAEEPRQEGRQTPPQEPNATQEASPGVEAITPPPPQPAAEEPPEAASEGTAAPEPPAPRPAPQAVQPAPRPKPTAVAPKPAPKPAAPPPAPEPTPAPEPRSEAQNPDGYMGMPEDLFD